MRESASQEIELAQKTPRQDPRSDLEKDVAGDEGESPSEAE